MKCPVCKSDYKKSDTICSTCGFPGLQVEFLNEEEYLEWVHTIVEPCKTMWENTHPNRYENFSYEQELDQYFNYSILCKQISNSPANFSIRSKMVDYLYQIYMYQYHYPINYRERLFDELLSHIEFFEQLACHGHGLRFKLTALEYLEKKAEIHLANGNLDQAVQCYYQFLSDDWFVKELKYIKNGGEPIFAVYIDMYYLILHNCSVICKMANVGQRMIASFEKLLYTIDEIRYTSYDRSYDYLYFQGMQLNIQSPNGFSEINEHLSQKGNIRSQGCTYDSCIYGPDENPIFRSFLTDVPWIGQQCTVENVLDEWNIVDVTNGISNNMFDSQKVFMYCLKIRSLFE